VLALLLAGCGARGTPMAGGDIGADTAEAKNMRGAMVAFLQARGTLRSKEVTDAIGAVPRHLFVPRDVPLSEAYADRPASLGEGRALVQPTVLAAMLEALGLHGDETLLVAGSGTGYEAAIGARLAKRIFTVEAAELGGKGRLDRLALPNVTAREGDPGKGWSDYAPYARVLFTAPGEVPAEVLAQLEDGGLLVVVEGGRLLAVRRKGAGFVREDLGAHGFAPGKEP